MLSLVYNGGAKLTLVGANTYSGSTTIGNGTTAAGTIAILADNGTGGERRVRRTARPQLGNGRPQ